MEVEARPLLVVLEDPYCPEDNKVGCRSCTGEEDCWKEVHEQGRCWMIDERCPECEVEHEDGECPSHCWVCEQERMKAEYQGEDR